MVIYRGQSLLEFCFFIIKTQQSLVNNNYYGHPRSWIVVSLLNNQKGGNFITAGTISKSKACIPD